MKSFRRLRLIAACGFLICLASCGIEAFIYLYPVTWREFTPSADLATNYYKFRTSDQKNDSESGDYFKGFEIFYRIYNNDAMRITDKSVINNYNSDNPTTAYTYLQTTKNYKRLSCAIRPTDIPLIPKASTNRDVIVRLIQYGTEAPQISVGADSSLYGEPRRVSTEGTIASDRLFDLDEIDNGDSDFTYSDSWDKTTAGKKLAFVQAYVIAYGYDNSLKGLYSELFELGCITLTEK